MPQCIDRTGHALRIRRGSRSRHISPKWIHSSEGYHLLIGQFPVNNRYARDIAGSGLAVFIGKEQKIRVDGPSLPQSASRCSDRPDKLSVNVAQGLPLPRASPDGPDNPMPRIRLNLSPVIPTDPDAIAGIHKEITVRTVRRVRLHKSPPDTG